MTIAIKSITEMSASTRVGHLFDGLPDNLHQSEDANRLMVLFSTHVDKLLRHLGISSPDAR